MLHPLPALWLRCLTLEQHAPNVNHHEADKLSRLRTVSDISHFQWHLQSYTAQAWSLQKILQPMVTRNSLAKKQEENLVSPVSVVLFQVAMNYIKLINKLIKAAIRSLPTERWQATWLLNSIYFLPDSPGGQESALLHWEHDYFFSSTSDLLCLPASALQVMEGRAPQPVWFIDNHTW